MAKTKKNVYFYKIVLKENNKEISHNGLYNIYKDIFALNGKTQEKSKQLSLDLTIDYSNDMSKYTMDILENNDDHLFCRIGRRKANNKMVKRDVALYSTDVIDVENQDKEWVEIFTYFLVDYGTGICATVFGAVCAKS